MRITENIGEVKTLPPPVPQSIGSRVRAMAHSRLGHEDIVVRLTLEGLRISDGGKKRIREIVFGKRYAWRRAAL